MTFGNMLVDGFMPASGTSKARRRRFQTLDGSRSIGRPNEVSPVLGQGLMFERPESRTIYIDREVMTFVEVTDDWIARKAIVAGQANEGAILGFTSKQRTVFQNGGENLAGGGGRIHEREN